MIKITIGLKKREKPIPEFERLSQAKDELKKAIDKAIKDEVKKIFAGMYKDFLRNCLYYHCPNIMKRLKPIKKVKD